MIKKYLNISEVSELLNIKEHVIRYWDSIDPKTNKLRIEGISTKSKGGTRYFNKENLSKLEKLKHLLYENGAHNHSLKLADKLLKSNLRSKNLMRSDNSYNNEGSYEKVKKIRQILKKMRYLANSDI